MSNPTTTKSIYTSIPLQLNGYNERERITSKHCKKTAYRLYFCDNLVYIRMKSIHKWIILSHDLLLMWKIHRSIMYSPNKNLNTCYIQEIVAFFPDQKLWVLNTL